MSLPREEGPGEGELRERQRSGCARCSQGGVLEGRAGVLGVSCGEEGGGTVGDSHGGGGWRRRHAGPPHMCVAASLPGAGPARWAGLQVTNRVEWQVWPGSHFHTPNHSPRNRDLPHPTSPIPQEHSKGLHPHDRCPTAPAALSDLSLWLVFPLAPPPHLQRRC